MVHKVGDNMLIDWSRIEILVDGDKPEDRAWITEMVGTLNTNMETRMINIQNSIDNNEMDKLQFELHQIKGVAANFGLDKLYNLVVDSETLIKEGNGQEAIEKAKSIQSIWLATQNELTQRFS